MPGAAFPSPNFGDRRRGERPDLVVIHYTAMESSAAARARLCDPGSEVSAHYLISETGVVDALVPDDLRAWHAGAGAWGDVTDVNSRSIGIELSNGGAEPFPEPQMAALETLLRDVLGRWLIPRERVIGHSDMAPGRKSDPGRRFDWRRLAFSGLSVWSERAEPGNFMADARTFGYVPPEGSRDAESLLLDAFRQRFRPFASGPPDLTDRAMIADLARRFPVASPPTSPVDLSG